MEFPWEFLMEFLIIAVECDSLGEIAPYRERPGETPGLYLL
jgi:hypothetical protein